MNTHDLNRQLGRAHSGQVHYDQNSPEYLSISGFTNESVNQLQHKLPPISQPILSRYRNQKFKTNLFKSSAFDSNFFTDFFCGKSNDESVSMCQNCGRSDHLNLCNFALSIVQSKYDWKNDSKFKSTYEDYNRNKKKLKIFLKDQQIQHRLMSRFNILGVILLQNHKRLLIRIIKNYIKHTIYYGDHIKLTLSNDLYFWFLIGIYYHVGVPKYFNDLECLPNDSISIHQPMMFWMLDIVMRKLHDCSSLQLGKLADETLDYCQNLYRNYCKVLVIEYQINLRDIFHQWFNQCMMGYMGIQFIGFFIKSILKQGYVYVQKTIMSYFQKRVTRLDNQEIISIENSTQRYEGLSYSNVIQSKKNKKQIIMKSLLDTNEAWPSIFFSTANFDFT